ncbi:MAG: anti-sigma factor family protein [Candidatus Saccharicenans sp.]|nr:MAG: hypothetical protein C0168_11410 [Candidatus Aminicenantes bacterium]HEK85879.1 zf-HC2 domain-containing protein [Candidatus Aminicenantes bacterium]
MNCRKALCLINDLLDDELKEKDRQLLEAHFKDCSSCRQVYEDLKAVKKVIIIADEIEPSGRVWEKVKSRLQAEVIPQFQAESFRVELEAEDGKDKEKPAKKFFSWLPVRTVGFKYVLATFIILVFITGAFFLGRYYQKANEPQLQASSENQALQKIQEAELYYHKAIESLTQALQASNNNWPPEMTEVLQANIRLLDRTINLCQQAVNSQPADFQAQGYLLSAYEAKMNFLNNMLETEKSLKALGRVRS